MYTVQKLPKLTWEEMDKAKIQTQIWPIPELTLFSAFCCTIPVLLFILNMAKRSFLFPVNIV